MSTIHVIGGGLAGMAAALALADAGRTVALYESAGHLGGRCRSFHDKHLDRVIDNGTHVLVGANRHALYFLERIGARDGLRAIDSLPFVDAESGLSWTLALRHGVLGLLPLKAQRLPGVRRRDQARLLRLLMPARGATVAERIDPASPLGKRVVEPLTLAIMNALPAEASASLLSRVLRRTLLARGEASKVHIARDGLGACLVDPAARALEQAGVTMHLNTRLVGLQTRKERVVRLDLADRAIELGRDDGVILTVPWYRLGAILPGHDVPEGARAITNLHYRLDRPARLVRGGPVLGLVGTRAQWLFVRGDIASVTISAADALGTARETELAGHVWREIRQQLVDAPDACPPCRVITERRATFLQSPAALAKRPAGGTYLANLALAGDWTDTGLPATIEGAILSGQRASSHFAAQTRPAVIQNGEGHPISGVP